MADGLFGTTFDPRAMIGVSMDTILIIVLALVGIGIIFLMYQFFAFNKTIIVRKVVNGRKIIMYDKAKLFKGKDGTLNYKFQKLKIIAPLPPTESLEITKKGKEFLECYLLESGEVSWIIDLNDIEPKKIVDEEGKTIIGNSINILQPFTTNQRQMLQHQFYKAHLEKGTSWKDQLGMIVYVGALVILVIAMMVFYGDMGKPLLQMGDKLSAFQTEQTKMIEKQIEMQDKLNEMLVVISNTQNSAGTQQTIPNRTPPS